jgi:nucleotide-binding universal stress UspA family protein
MLRTILVPQDGSVLAEQAIPYAVRLARSTGATIVLVRATAASPLPGADAGVTERAAIARAEAELGAIADRLRDDGLTVNTHVFYDAADTAILTAARQEDADLIVMSTHGRSGLNRWVYGSVADAVMRAAPVPVLLVPATCTTTWAAERPLRLLVPLDGSAIAEAALGPVGELATALGAELLLTQVVELPVPMLTDGAVYIPDWDPEEELVSARQYLEDTAAGPRATGCTVRTEAIAGPLSVVGQAARVIADTAAQEDVDVIAMATHGRGGLARLVMGSVATGVLQRASVPLLLVRPAAVERRNTGITAAEAAGIGTAG